VVGAALLLPRLIACCALALAPASAPQDAGRARGIYVRAVQLEADGNHPAALSLLWEAAGLAPRDADIQNRLGEALERIGALDAAVDAYRRAVAERPSFRKASNNLILTLGKVGKGAEGVERARALLAAAPDDPERLFTLGLALSEQDVDESVRVFRRTLELAPRNTLARYNLALVLRRVDRPVDALDELQRALAIERRPEALYTQGVIYWHLGELKRAEDSLREAIAATPDYADAHHALGAVLKTRREWKGAAASLRKAIALRPDLFSARYALAQVLTASGDERGARAAIEEAERLRQRNDLEREALMWTTVGIQKGENGDLNGALESLRKATAAFEPYAPAHYQLGLVLRRLGQPAAARAAFARAHQLNPSLVPPANR
jgi:tetratricopeptide (TPR) repeat protein